MSRPRSADGTEGSLDARQRSRKMAVGASGQSLEHSQPAGANSGPVLAGVSTSLRAIPEGFRP